MNKATLVGVWPSNRSSDDRPNRDNYTDMDDFADDVEAYGRDIIDRVLDTMGRDCTLIVTEHALGRISNESFRLLMDYLSKYDGMLRDEV